MFVWTVFGIILCLFGIGEIYKWISYYSMIKNWKTSIQKYEPHKIQHKLCWEDKQVLVLVNPISGDRLGRIIYQVVIKPMFQKANIHPYMMETTRPGHAQDHIRTLNESSLSQYSGIVVVGGDGSVLEVLNGIRERIEHHENISEPTDSDPHIISSTLWYQKFQQLLNTYPIAVVPAGTTNALSDKLSSGDVVEAVKKIIEGQPHKLSLNRVEFPKTKQKPVWDCLVTSWGAVPDFDYLQEVKYRHLGWLRNVLAPLIVLSRGKSYEGTLKILPSPLSEQQKKNKRYFNSNDLESEPGSEWKIIKERHFLMVFAANVAVGPVKERDTRVLAHEGSFDLVVVSKCSRKEALDIFLGLDSGEYMNNPKVSLYKARELKMEPTAMKAMFSLSGELIRETPLHMISFPDLLSLVY